VDNPLADIDQIEKIADPLERAREIGLRLAAITPWQERLKRLRQAAVLELKASRWSYAEIARELGLHRNRVQQIAEGRPGGGKGGVKDAIE
jgi:DNA-directed RNA polymerase specialized sigma24 family protein